MEKVCLIKVESYVIHCDYSAQPLVDILSGGFNQEVEWKTPNLDPKWDMHERDNLSDQALLPPAKHQVVFIEAPRAIVLYPPQLALKFKPKQKQSFPNVHNFNIVAQFPYRSQQILGNP